MSLISSTIPNFVNGISQQPFTLRLSSQAEAQENGMSTAATGLRKRPPTYHVNIQPTNTVDVFVHTINRDSVERYFVVIENGDLKVYDMFGNAKVVNFPNGKGYLATQPHYVCEQIAACSVADYTFIVNKNVTVQRAPQLSPPRWPEALVSVKQGNYGKTYKIYLDGVQAGEYSTPNGTGDDDSRLIATDWIAGKLVESMRANGYTGDWGFNCQGSIIHITRSNKEFGISIQDGFNGNAMMAIKDRVAQFSDLPTYARIPDFMIEVAGDRETKGDNYWVKYKLNSASTGTADGVWTEIVQPSCSLGLDPATMPHVLVREADGSFTFKEAAWDQRTAGDTDTNKDPSFVGRQLADVFFYRNRLGVLADENVIFTEAGSYFNFFRTTCVTNLDADRIDVATTHTKVSILRHAVPFNKQLMLFADSAQFSIDNTDVLTQATITIKLATEFPVNAKARPIGSGRNVYFAVDKGNWSAVREYYVDTANAQNDASDITAHVPRYVPSGLLKIAASANEDMMVMMSLNERNALYVYKYYFSNNEKLQSSWSKWTFGPFDYICGYEIIDSTLVALIFRQLYGVNQLYFEHMDLSAESVGVDEPYLVHLDRKTRIPAPFWDSTWKCSRMYGLPYVPSMAEEYCVVVSTKNDASRPIKPGSVFPVIPSDDGGARVEGVNLDGYDLIFGRKYKFRYELSPVLVRSTTSSGSQKADTEGRLQLRKISFNYADTGQFDVNVTPQGRQTFNYRFTGKTLGISSVLGQVALPTGKFSVPVLSQNIGTKIEIINDSPLPSSFLSADWEGFYVKRSQPV